MHKTITTHTARVVTAGILLIAAPLSVADDDRPKDASSLDYTSVFDLSDGPQAPDDDTSAHDEASTRESAPKTAVESSRRASANMSTATTPRETAQARDLSTATPVNNESVSGLPEPIRSEPTLAAARPPLRYDSAFDRYKRFEEAAAPAWIKANEQVRKIGGWQAYAREMYEANKAREAADMEAGENAGKDGGQ